MHKENRDNIQDPLKQQQKILKLSEIIIIILFLQKQLEGHQSE